MEILFESNTETEQQFDYDGQTIVNKGNVEIVLVDDTAVYEAKTI